VAVVVALADIKADLPNWPDDVVDQWVLKLANQSGMGWPPPDPMEGHRWEPLLTHLSPGGRTSRGLSKRATAVSTSFPWMLDGR
jgi:hypothetical protein